MKNKKGTKFQDCEVLTVSTDTLPEADVIKAVEKRDSRPKKFHELYRLVKG